MKSSEEFRDRVLASVFELRQAFLDEGKRRGLTEHYSEQWETSLEAACVAIGSQVNGLGATLQHLELRSHGLPKMGNAPPPKGKAKIVPFSRRADAK